MRNGGLDSTEATTVPKFRVLRFDDSNADFEERQRRAHAEDHDAEIC
jgi:hypothetical protein